MSSQGFFCCVYILLYLFRGELYLSNCSDFFIVVLLTFSRVIIDDCTGEMNLPLRLRCVRCYTFTQWMSLVVCLLDYEWCTGEINLPLRLRCVCCYTFTHWINLVVCLLDYEWLSGEMNLPLRLRCVRCYTFTQWINFVVCLLDYEWLSGEMNLPLRLRCVRWYYALNKPCGVFVGLWMMYGRDESAPTPTVCALLYIYAMDRPCGMSVDIHLRNK